MEVSYLQIDLFVNAFFNYSLRILSRKLVVYELPDILGRGAINQNGNLRWFFP